jgi:hypothetical protein
MMARRLETRRLAALAAGLCLAGQAAAQGLSAQQLLQSGDQSYRNNCVRGTKYYFALIQQFPTRLGAEDTKRLQGMIASCEEHPLAPGLDAKMDGVGQPECAAYAEIAVAEAHAAASIPRCHAGGPRWSTDAKFHYNWCMSRNVSRDTVRDERNARREFLDNCAFK